MLLLLVTPVTSSHRYFVLYNLLPCFMYTFGFWEVYLSCQLKYMGSVTLGSCVVWMMVAILQIIFVTYKNRLASQPRIISPGQQETRTLQWFNFHLIYSQFKHRSELPKIPPKIFVP